MSMSLIPVQCINTVFIITIHFILHFITFLMKRGTGVLFVFKLVNKQLRKPLCLQWTHKNIEKLWVTKTTQIYNTDLHINRIILRYIKTYKKLVMLQSRFNPQKYLTSNVCITVILVSYTLLYIVVILHYLILADSANVNNKSFDLVFWFGMLLIWNVTSILALNSIFWEK